MNSSAIQARVDRERTFHDSRFADNPKRDWGLSALMSAITLDAVYRTYNTARLYCEQGATVLDYGCAQGESSVILRRYGACHVDAIDISPVAIDQAAHRATQQGVDGITFRVMDAQTLEYPSARFDLVFGIAILHHLDLRRALSEVARVLKPTGVAVFLEPLGHNPIINFVRRCTPQLRTKDESPLHVSDLKMIETCFGQIDFEYVNLTTLLSVPVARVPGSTIMRRSLAAADRGLFAVFPALRRFAWNVVLTLAKPTANHV